jgi:hypothetical protein
MVAAEPAAAERAASAAQEADAHEEELNKLRARRQASETTFVHTVRTAAIRMFRDIRTDESTVPTVAAPSWRLQPSERTAGVWFSRSLRDVLETPGAALRSGLPERRQPVEDSSRRHLLRAWAQLTPERQRRVLEFVEDQRRLSIQEELSEHAQPADEPGEAPQTSLFDRPA